MRSSSVRFVLFFVSLALGTAIVGCDAGYEYVTCTTSADCRAGASCQTITWTGGSGRMCTGSCGLSSDCPHSGRCIDIAGDAHFLCFDHCVPATGCGVGFVCQTLTNGDSICLPGGPTP